ncbi:hypothetical protein DUNSADRAFT_7560 [Dunaliella salina]|uniref:Uncharacterized protein n=1 Tax=Dunaliella salina TaxID=3046 RepID=A0ABZ3L1N0_DUNSA|nr:hypothetical protein DUNSADRAFT_7560 [Dunaliella salina]|eukprot:KAF5835328.1 hypothetical protein DUNSADRAFT_7560 [Dunaliella salina]
MQASYGRLGRLVCFNFRCSVLARSSAATHFHRVLIMQMHRKFEKEQIGTLNVWVGALEAVYYGSAYYLGKYRGSHDWPNFTISGGIAGTCLSLYLIRPPVLRTTVFGTLMGMAVGTVSGYGMKAVGIPYWNESRGFEGWWLGEYIDEKSDNPNKAKKEVA